MVLYGRGCSDAMVLSRHGHGVRRRRGPLSHTLTLTLTHPHSHSHSLSPSLSAGMVCLGGAGGAAAECLENSEPNEAQATNLEKRFLQPCDCLIV